MQELWRHGRRHVEVSSQPALAGMLLGECLVKHHRFVDLATEVTLILTKHVEEGVLGALGQVARLQDALVTIHLEVGLLLGDHRL